MKLVNETGQEVFYGISYAGAGDCGTIPVDGIADLPFYDNQQNVQVSFVPVSPAESFSITVENTKPGQQIEMTVVAE